MTTLRKVDIDLDRGQLQIRQGKSAAASRVLDLTGESKLILARRMGGASPWVFPSKRKKGGHVERLNNAHDALLKKAAEDGLTLASISRR